MSPYEVLSPGPTLDNWIELFIMSGQGLAKKKYSNTMAPAWSLMDKIAHFVGDYDMGDGFFHLAYAESASHQIEISGLECSIESPWTQAIENEGKLLDELSLEKMWSAHCHFGIVSTKVCDLLPHIDVGSRYCAVGVSAPHAICLSALKMYESFGDENHWTKFSTKTNIKAF